MSRGGAKKNVRNIASARAAQSKAAKKKQATQAAPVWELPDGVSLDRYIEHMGEVAGLQEKVGQLNLALANERGKAEGICLTLAEFAGADPIKTALTFDGHRFRLNPDGKPGDMGMGLAEDLAQAYVEKKEAEKKTAQPGVGAGDDPDIDAIDEDGATATLE